MRHQVVLLFVGAMAALLPAEAQTSGGAFTGEVRDQSGAVIPGAKVTIKRVETGTEVSTVSTSEGVFGTPSLTAGEYLLSAEKPGFKSEVFGPVLLQVNQTVRVDFVMNVGATTESVRVEASGAQLLSSESAEISQVISSTQVAELPLNGRSWQQLIVLSPGVNPGATGETGSPSPVNVNGQRSKANLFLVDGISTTSSAQGRGNGFNVPLEAVREFSVQAGAYSAEYGNVAGGVINLQIKSGTNNWHGSLFEYFRNDKLDAANYFANATKQPKNPLRYNQYGGSIGGPIRKDKTFIFGDYQSTRSRNSNPFIGTLPLPAQIKGDFSALRDAIGLVPIHDSFTAARTPFPGNIIPANRINSAAGAITALMPLPNQFGGNGQPLAINNYAVSRSAASDFNAFDVRVDHQFSSRSNIFARHSFQHTRGFSPSIFGPPLGGPPALAGNAKSGNQNTGIGHIYQIRPNLINEFRLGLTRQTSTIEQEDFGQNLSEKFGIPGINRSPETSGLTNLNISGYLGFGGSILTPVSLEATAWNASEKLMWTFGRHTLRAGFDYQYEIGSTGYLVFGRGFYVFEPLMTSSLTTLATTGRAGGHAFASFLMGAPTSVIRDIFPPGQVQLRSPRYGTYFQDDFKVSSRLVLNLGARYDIMPYAREQYNRLSNFNPATRTMLLAGVDTSERIRNTDFRNLAPRVGLAYAVGAQRKMVIRAGYGIGYVDPIGGTSVLNSNEFNIPFYYRESLLQFPFNPPANSLTSRFPDLVMPSAKAPVGDQRYIPPDDRNQYSQTWSLSIQRSITRSTMAEVAYVGTSGNRLMMPYNLNAALPGATDPTTRRPFGPTLGEIRAVSNQGHSTYHGLQARLEHRFSHGLYFLGSYAWSKSLDNQSNGTDDSASSGQYPQDSRNFNLDRGLSSFDRTQRLVTSAVWEIPYGRGRHYGSNAATPVNFLVGGWQMSGIYVAQTGSPFSVTMACTNINAEGNNCRTNRIADGSLPESERTIARYFDTKAFPKPTTPVYGNAGRNILHGPGLSNIDLSLAKSFRWGSKEIRRVQFRADFFNAFNNTHFGLPVHSFDSPAIGVISGAAAARIVQLGLRFGF